MSAIAQWYLLPTARVGELTALCPSTETAKSDFKSYKPLWRFLETQTVHVGSLDASGWVTNPLLVYLEGLGVPVRASCEHPLVKVIDIDSFLVIENAEAHAWSTGLATALTQRDALEPYLADWYGSPLDVDAVEVHLEALRYLHDGVSRITADAILLLSVG